ncbi:helix-turn-helix domain-containing protein [Tuberibacillus sp. Marseille-P3662]|uniref:helix-turn-helix domain-containing protein n=1 Tax=Tuberibacillus sp. Marseille-P3662 TaxID=1965358 RepID=UPI000A1C84BF|nr:helix-turn-helix domain-containing protein [Tuberibacillus sp. Marseille-P3662]
MIGQRIRYYRKQTGLTLEKLAEGICSVSYLSKIEHGDKSSDEVAKLLCDRLGIAYEDVDNQAQLEETRRLLDHWYKEIRDKVFYDYEDYKDRIEESLGKAQSPLLNIRFDLFQIKYLTAKSNFEKAKERIANVEQYHELMDDELLYYYHHFLGIYYGAVNAYDDAIVHFEKAEKAIQELTLGEAETGELWYQIALVHSNHVQFTRAMDYANKGLDIFNKQYNLKRIADCQVILGISSRAMKNYRQAEYHYTQALKFIELLNDDYRKSVVYYNLAVISAYNNEFHQSIDYFKNIIDLLGETSHLAVSSQVSIAESYYYLNDIPQCNKELDRARELIRCGNYGKEYPLFLEIIYKKANQIYDHSYENLLKNKALPYYKSSKRLDKIVEYAEVLGDIYYNKKHYKRASEYYRLAKKTRDDIN